MSAGQNPPFLTAVIVTLAASTTSASASIPAQGETLVVTNTTSALAWIAIGTGTSLTAVAGACIPVLPSSRRIIAASGVNVVAAVLAAGTGDLVVEIGTGSAT